MAKRTLFALVALLFAFAFALAACGDGDDGPPASDTGIAPDGATDSGASLDGRPILPELGHWAWRRVCHQGLAVNEVTVSAQAGGACGGAPVAPYLRVRFDDTQPLAHVETLGSQQQRMTVGGATVSAELCRASSSGQVICDNALSGWVAAAAESGSAVELRAVEVSLDFSGVSVRLRSPMFEICAFDKPPGC
ncbi:MAG: hypothetical protein KC503_08740 [Myxococcales bacterium]|nr:hypothetical protein [Myxococcales bacterium]